MRARGTAGPALINSLTEFVDLARNSDQDVLADLGAALLQILPAMAIGPEREERLALFLAGYELLVDQLNGMMTDRGPIDRSAVSRFVDGLQGVQSRAGGEIRFEWPLPSGFEGSSETDVATAVRDVASELLPSASADAPRPRQLTSWCAESDGVAPLGALALFVRTLADPHLNSQSLAK